MAPRGQAVLAFYLGTTGTLEDSLQRDKPTLRKRFNKYVGGFKKGQLIGPRQEKCKEKLDFFEELQRKGFSLWFRCGSR